MLTIDTKSKRKSKDDKQPSDSKQSSSRKAVADEKVEKVQRAEETYRRSAEERVARRWGLLSYLLPGLGLGAADAGAEQLPDAAAGADAGGADAHADAGPVDDWADVDVDEMGFEEPVDGLIDDVMVEADADAIAADLGVHNELNLLEDSPSAAFDEGDGDELSDDEYELEAEKVLDELDGRRDRTPASESERSKQTEKARASDAAAPTKSSLDADNAMKSVLSSLTLKEIGSQLRAFVRTLYERDRHAERERWQAAHNKVQYIIGNLEHPNSVASERVVIRMCGLKA